MRAGPDLLNSSKRRPDSARTFRQMPSTRLCGSMKMIRQRRAIGLYSAIEKKRRALLAYEASASSNGIVFQKNKIGHNTTSNNREYDRSHISFEIPEKDCVYTITELQNQWYISWNLENDESGLPAIVFRVDRTHIDGPYSYELRFHVLLKNYGLILHKKVQIDNESHDRLTIRCKSSILCSLEKSGWSDILVSGSVLIRKHSITWMDAVKSECSFLSPERPYNKILIVGGIRFYVQSLYLATWSRVFDRMFYGFFREANEKEVVIGEVCPKQLLDLLMLIHPRLDFGINERNFKYLLKLAHYFDMPSVTSMCSNWLSDFNNSRRLFILGRIEIADRYGLMGLLHSCCRHILKNNDVMRDFVIKNQNELSALSKKTQQLVEVSVTAKDPSPWKP